MKFALHFGNFAFSDPEGARRLVRLAEAAGFDSVFAVEHVVVPNNYTSVYPYAPGGRLPGGPSAKLPDPLIWLTWVAAATTRLRFMTAVMILPQRNPLVLAKEVATLDYLSGGRIELGIGVGWLKEEFDALGIPFERRGTPLPQHLSVALTAEFGDSASKQQQWRGFLQKSRLPDSSLGETVALVASLLWPPTQVAVAGSPATALWDAPRLNWLPFELESPNPATMAAMREARTLGKTGATL